MAPEKTCRLVTLGCKVNQYETQYVKEALELNGYREAEANETADLCIVNTCTVTMDGDAKSRQTIRRLNHANPGAEIVVMGCYATRDPQAVAKLPGVSQVITDKDKLAEHFQAFGVHDWPAHITRFDGHQRAFLKVQDGCLLNCSYCIIPTVRPRLRSRPLEEIVAEARELVGNGVQEIVLTGIHLGHFGLDLSRGRAKSEWSRLWHLLEALDAIPGHFRVRLSSLEAAEARDDLIRAMANCSRVVPHLHLCLQAGSDRILRAMKRRYTQAGFLRRAERIRDQLDQPAFTTDIIVGFPGETREDFEATCKVAREVGFAKIHVFSYSAREGTPAARLRDFVPPPVIAQRRTELLAVERETSEEFQKRLVGRRLSVMAEGSDSTQAGQVVGTSCRYVPVSFAGDAAKLRGKLVNVKIDRWAEDRLHGTPIPASWSLEPSSPTSLSVDPQGRIALPMMLS